MHSGTELHNRVSFIIYPIINVLILPAPDTTPKSYKNNAMHPYIGLYHTSETLTKTKNRFKTTHPLRRFDTLGFSFQVLVGFGG